MWLFYLYQNFGNNNLQTLATNWAYIEYISCLALYSGYLEI
jgi:hypothetical protein